MKMQDGGRKTNFYVTNLDGVGHGFADAHVTDIGCRSCGLWSYGFAGAVVVFGAEVGRFWVLDGRSMTGEGEL